MGFGSAASTIYGRYRSSRLATRTELLGRPYGKFSDRFPSFVHHLPFVEWRLVARDRETWVLRNAKGTTMYLDAYHGGLVLRESHAWGAWYLPGFSLEGGTVLDAGAGCLECCPLWFGHGAKKVIAVESNPLLEKYIRANIRLNNWNVEVHMEPLSPKHLNLDYTFAKIDCEGGERVMLEDSVPGTIPVRLEIHPQYMRAGEEGAIISKFRLESLDWGGVWGNV